MPQSDGGPSDPDVTALLEAWNRGDPGALDRLVEAVHRELRRIAVRVFQGERPDHTLQPTAVVNELYLRLRKERQVSWHDRAQLFSVAARLMRRILVDHARRHAATRSTRPWPAAKATSAVRAASWTILS